MVKRQVFFSFRYLYDTWRVSQIRNMGKVSDDSTFSDNDWEVVHNETDESIRNWIKTEMKMRSCIVVLIGEHTNGRKWINFEIEHAWKNGKGIVGINIHRLKDSDGKQANKGNNPFSDFCIDTKINYIAHHSIPSDNTEKNLTTVIKTYNPPYSNSTNVYDYINNHIADWIEEAIIIRNKYPK